MAMIKGTDSDVWLTASPSITIGASPEACTDSGDHIVYTTNTHTAWDKTHPMLLEQSPNGSSGWSDVATNQYSVAYPIGRITFVSARTPGVNNFIRVKATTGGYYYNLTQLDECHVWSLDQKANFIDTTPFQATSGYTRKTFTTKDGSGKIDSYRTDDRVFLELGNLTVMKLYADKTNTPKAAWACYAWITGIAPKSDANGVNEQSYSFETEGEVYYVTV